jgi:acetaldehyde dehydrogenase / alcohol dehydrogenase
MSQQSVGSGSQAPEHERSLISHINNLVRTARLAAAVFTQYSQEDVDRIVKAMTLAALENVYKFVQMAYEETRMGQIEDKMLKDFVASEFLYNQIKDKRTVGVVREFPEDNMVEIAEPMGVILALSPVTNPTSTIIFKSLCAAKTRNTLIFSPHLMAANSSNHVARVLYEAGLAAGAPKGFISWVEKSSRLRRETEMMMVHPDVDLIFATGGTQMVKAAHSSGKPAIGVGSGNTPVYIHKSAFVEGAVTDIIISKTFDNGTECPSEQTVVVDREVYDEVIRLFSRLGCHVCSPEEVERVARTVIDPKTKGMNYKFVGQPAALIAEAAGIAAATDVKILICPLAGELRLHPLAVEKLMPVLGIVAVDSVDEGINRALDVNYAGGTGHTAGVFATDEEVIEKYATAINAGRIIVNSPTSMGGLGGIYNNLNTTLSFGCGTGGGNITTDNVGVQNLLNYKRVPRRKNFVMSFQTTKNIYINPGSIEHLRALKTRSAFIVTSGSAASRGHLSMVLERLPENCRVDVYSQVGVEPDFATVEKAVKMMRKSQPDTVIALGGGSVLDAAKIMRLFYDCPNLKLSDVATPFLDFRQRVVKFPTGTRTTLVAIPTTSGTGSEVTPFAVLKDPVSQTKYSLVDESLLPDVAILDAQLTRSLPPQITVDTAVDALSHALEALVSILSSDYTDGLALEAIRLIFEALPEAVKNGSNVVWRHKLHNAACLAGMAIGNASVGVNHALAHSLGARFDIPHGRANSVFLLSTLEYNSQIPRKITPHSTHTHFVAPKKYARAARFLGLDEKQAGLSDDEMVVLLRRAVFDMLSSLGQPLSLEELGIPAAELLKAGRELVKTSFEDMSLRTNPRLALLSDLEELYQKSYPRRLRP